MAIGHFSSQTGSVGLKGSGKVKPVLGLKLADGRFAVFGKVVLANTDDGPQNGLVQLRFFKSEDGPFSVLDESFARIAKQGQADRLTLSVQSKLIVKGIGFVGIGCATYEGRASNAQLTAIRLDFAM